MNNEQKAITIGENPRLVREQLFQAKSVLSNHLHKGFGMGVFDSENKTLTGINRVVLQWRVRQYPDQPESYDNQQTNIGVVVIQ